MRHAQPRTPLGRRPLALGPQAPSRPRRSLRTAAPKQPPTDAPSSSAFARARPRSAIRSRCRLRRRILRGLRSPRRTTRRPVRLRLVALATMAGVVAPDSAGSPTLETQARDWTVVRAASRAPKEGRGRLEAEGASADRRRFRSSRRGHRGGRTGQRARLHRSGRRRRGRPPRRRRRHAARARRRGVSTTPWCRPRQS